MASAIDDLILNELIDPVMETLRLVGLNETTDKYGSCLQSLLKDKYGVRNVEFNVSQCRVYGNQSPDMSSTGSRLEKIHPNIMVHQSDGSWYFINIKSAAKLTEEDEKTMLKYIRGSKKNGFPVKDTGYIINFKKSYKKESTATDFTPDIKSVKLN